MSAVDTEEVVSAVGFGIATLVIEGAVQVAVRRGGRCCPLSDLLADREVRTSVRELFPRWDEVCDAIERALPDADGPWRDLSQVSFLPPVPDPPTIYCSGANYHDHVEEMGRNLEGETVPFHFLTPPSAMTGHRRPVRRPPGEGVKLDWEVELVAVIGRRAEEVSPEDALGVVAGYTIADDVSVRDWGTSGRHPFFGHRWLERKGRSSLLPVGPDLVPARFVPDPMNLALGLEVNGVARQSSRTDEMIFSVAEQISYLSSLTALLPGDLILTGTPAGTAAAHGRYLDDGDRVVARIEKLGELENQIVGR